MGHPYAFKGNSFSGGVHNVMLQAGTPTESVFGGLFPDDAGGLGVPHSHAGLVSMVSAWVKGRGACGAGRRARVACRPCVCVTLLSACLPRTVSPVCLCDTTVCVPTSDCVARVFV